MWDLPRPGFEPVSPALAGGFLTTVPPGKPLPSFLKNIFLGKEFRLIFYSSLPPVKDVFPLSVTSKDKKCILILITFPYNDKLFFSGCSQDSLSVGFSSVAMMFSLNLSCFGVIRLLKSISLCLLPHLGDFQPLFFQIFFQLHSLYPIFLGLHFSICELFKFSLRSLRLIFFQYSLYSLDGFY